MRASPNLFSIIDFYIDDLFAVEDAVLKTVLTNARSAGLPEIQVTRGQGKFLYLLAKIVNARCVLEVGTLAGYSAIWMARALPAGGHLVTLESDQSHATVAAQNIGQAGLSHCVDLVVGAAAETLPKVIKASDYPFDLIFLDADKPNYSLYLDLILPGTHSGSLILADNVIREGTVMAPQHDDPSASAARTFNATIATDARLEAIILQQVGVKGHDGLAIARVK